MILWSDASVAFIALRCSMAKRQSTTAPRTSHPSGMTVASSSKTLAFICLSFREPVTLTLSYATRIQLKIDLLKLDSVGNW